MVAVMPVWQRQSRERLSAERCRTEADLQLSGAQGVDNHLQRAGAGDDVPPHLLQLQVSAGSIGLPCLYRSRPSDNHGRLGVLLRCDMLCAAECVRPQYLSCEVHEYAEKV